MWNCRREPQSSATLDLHLRSVVPELTGRVAFSLRRRAHFFTPARASTQPAERTTTLLEETPHMTNTPACAAQAPFSRHIARFAAGIVAVTLAAGCSTPSAPIRAQPQDSVVSALGSAEGRVGSKRRTVRVEGRSSELSVETPAEWTVGTARQLDQIDEDNRDRAEHFLLAEILAVDDSGRGRGESKLVVSIRRPPKFTIEDIAGTSQSDLDEANLQLLTDDGAAQPSFPHAPPINVAQWELRQIDVNGQSVRCLEMTILKHIGEDLGQGDLAMQRTLYIPQLLAEIRVQMSYRVLDEDQKLPMMRAAVASLRF